MTPKDITLARSWLAAMDQMLPPEMQGIIDTIEQALEMAMEKLLNDALDEAGL